ncbi:hypothetical protein ACQ4M4_13585 [Leptolyngbya sp. AN02str]|uniref:hypothetical protein n=1 Tax=Leptolyngbya sp. AN02str TaxID=3423363 RepID=UPI003D314297
MPQLWDAVSLGISLAGALGNLGISRLGYRPFPGIHVPTHSLIESATLLGTSATSLIRQELKGQFNAAATGMVHGFGYEFNDFLTHVRSSRCRLAPA